MQVQSEQVLENELLNQLSTQYTRIKLKDMDELLQNFRKQINKLNQDVLQNEELTNKEFERLLLLVNGKSVYQSAKNLRDKIILTRDDNSQVYLKLIDTKNCENNIYQISNQITVKDKYTNRYDVTILINGLPLVQIELKRRGKDMKEAFNQIERYKRHSYHGLFRYIQLFIISNGVDTKYYANSDAKALYSLTFFWSDENNKRLTKLDEFAQSFLAKENLWNMLLKYMIINDTDKILMVMRPYQIYATQKLINQALTTNQGGYIWHTTGSGKTLTSFKCSQLLAQNPKIKKVFFVVDRSDLDRQTTQEFNRFEANAVDATDNTAILAKQINDEHKNFIVTTIQKLAKAVNTTKYQDAFSKYTKAKIVIIFDECHRSTFGKQLNDILKVFPQAQIFGFTGTPRFIENKSEDKRTTADIFGKCLHTYLIKDAIFDHNVLGFNVEYINTFKGKYDPTDDTKIEAIDKEEVFNNEERLELIAKHIVKYHDIKTHNRQYNALFAVSSVEVLLKYYKIFKKLDTDLKVSAIYTFESNEEAETRDKHSRESLEDIIKDYNKMYNTNYSTDTFAGYASDLMKKIKTAQIDIVIVVGMMLTGFDAKVLNTLYVDKNLEYHNLLQAYSRTNRVEQSTKPFGNIICYRNLKEKTDQAISLFSQTDNIDDVLVRDMKYYLKIFQDKLIRLLEIAPTPASVDSLQSEQQKRDFIIAFKTLIKLKSILTNFVEFDFEKQIKGITLQEFEDFKSKYLYLYEKQKVDYQKEKASILKDIDFCIELVATDRINVDYIFNLINSIDRHDKIKQQAEIKEIKLQLRNTDNIQLRYKVDLIEEFLDEVVPNLNADISLNNAYDEFAEKKRTQEIDKFAKEHDFDTGFLQQEIDEYEYTGIANKSKIMQQVKKSFIEKSRIANIAIDFIKTNVARYF